MKRIKLPDCTCCGKVGAAHFESELRPSVKLCYDCIDAVSQCAFELRLPSNILLDDLLSGTSSEESAVTVTCWPEHDDGVKKPWTYWKSESRKFT